MKTGFTALFCPVDDFCQNFEPRYHQRLLTGGIKRRRRQSRSLGSGNNYHRHCIPPGQPPHIQAPLPVLEARLTELRLEAPNDSLKPLSVEQERFQSSF